MTKKPQFFTRNSTRNIKRSLVTASAFTLLAVSWGGCAHNKGVDIQREAAKGPVIINPRSEPGTVELNRFLQPKQPQQFFAEIQDFAAPVTDAKLQLNGTSIEVPMEKIGGTTWRGELSSDQLKRLAISGQKMEYQARMIARDQNGTLASSPEMINIKVAAPKFEPDAG
jgi:hypothetical protein